MTTSSNAVKTAVDATNELNGRYHIAAILAFLSGLAAFGVILADGADVIDIWDQDHQRERDGMFMIAILTYCIAAIGLGLATRPALLKKEQDFNDTVLMLKRFALALTCIILAFHLTAHLERGDNDVLIGLEGYMTALLLLASVAAVKSKSDKELWDVNVDEGNPLYARRTMAALVVLSFAAAFALNEQPDFTFNGGADNHAFLAAGIMVSAIGALVYGLSYDRDKSSITGGEEGQKISYMGYRQVGSTILSLGLLSLCVGALYTLHMTTEAGQSLETGVVYGALAVSSGITAYFAGRSVLKSGTQQQDGIPNKEFKPF